MNVHDIVTLVDLLDDDDLRGTVRQVEGSENMPAPDEGMVLVVWSRTSIRWEYAEDLRVVRAVLL